MNCTIPQESQEAEHLHWEQHWPIPNSTEKEPQIQRWSPWTGQDRLLSDLSELGNIKAFEGNDITTRESSDRYQALDHWRWQLFLRPDFGFHAAAPALPNYPLLPISELPPRRRVTWVWVCCCCGHGAMKVAAVSNEEQVTVRDILRVDRMTNGKSDMIREHEPDVSEIPTFILPDPRWRRWERIASYIESFCHGASFILDSSVPAEIRSNTFEDTQEPRAWVSDRNYTLEGLPTPERDYGRVLDSIELYSVLQRKRFRDDACDDTIGHCRRIYINYPSGTSILALVRTAVVTQREGFSELFANYVTESPTPKIGLKDSGWWNGCFVISFTLPFFAIRTEDREDPRGACDETKPFRRRRSLSFLGTNRLWQKAPESDDSKPHRFKGFLHEAACAFMITGKSERYWTAVFLDEDFHVDQPKLSVEYEEDVVIGSIDPIIIKAELKDTATTASPRAYALASLAATLRGIVEHHTDIQDEFGASLLNHISNNRLDLTQSISYQNIQAWRNNFQDALELVMYGNLRLFRKVDEFLQQDILIGPDRLPRHPLWSSVQDEPDAVSSLRSIIESRNRLREISNDLLHFSEEAKREWSTRKRRPVGLARVSGRSNVERYNRRVHLVGPLSGECFVIMGKIL
ncbi:hypothetical protein FSARC_2870 [Fusarium sarcochroum]|uniref:Uncharacterized protein n=1 Tax=Fusarium sarcochroum TaxID=1208366 RepID=A0A8H4XCJ8_9HYPO|nr:hypothetical protein FSARC_2870 [Fusarium sarcochroum]